MDSILEMKTDNSYNMRIQLEKMGYPCLRFSTYGKYIKVSHGQCANSSETWVEKYSYASDNFEDIKFTELKYVDNIEFLNNLRN